MNRYDILKNPKKRAPRTTVREMQGSVLSFSMTESQSIECQAWQKKHRCIHSSPGSRAQFSYRFTPVFAGKGRYPGMIVNTKCLCGKSRDLTDMEEWG